MSTSPRIAESNTIVASPALAAETDICEVTGITTRTADGIVYLLGSVSFTVGTGGVTATLKLRRGQGTGGTVLATSAAETVVAGNKVDMQLDATDTPGLVAGQTYTLTLTVTTGSAASTVAEVTLRAEY